MYSISLAELAGFGVESIVIYYAVYDKISVKACIIS